MPRDFHRFVGCGDRRARSRPHGLNRRPLSEINEDSTTRAGRDTHRSVCVRRCPRPRPPPVPASRSRRPSFRDRRQRRVRGGHRGESTARSPTDIHDVDAGVLQEQLPSAVENSELARAAHPGFPARRRGRRRRVHLRTRDGTSSWRGIGDAVHVARPAVVLRSRRTCSPRPLTTARRRHPPRQRRVQRLGHRPPRAIDGRPVHEPARSRSTTDGGPLTCSVVHARRRRHRDGALPRRGRVP